MDNVFTSIPWNSTLAPALSGQIRLQHEKETYVAHSFGANLFTPAATLASIKFFCAKLVGSEGSRMKESTVLTPWRCFVNASLLV